MEQRDFLTKQIEQMGKVLAKILADILQLSSADEPEESIAQSTRQLKELLDIDLDQLNQLSPSELTQYLKQRHFNPELLENLAKSLQAIGDKQLILNQQSACASYRTALQVLNSADIISETFSYKREEVKSELQTSIDTHKLS